MSRVDDALVDVLVVGGSLAGAAAARALVAEGFSVLLTERRDIGRAHAGILPRLLLRSETGAAANDPSRDERRARAHWSRISPAAIRPVPILAAAPARRSALGRLRDGLRAARDSWPAPRSIDVESARALLPAIIWSEDERLMLRHEAQCDGARLALLFALDARRLGATLATRCEVLGLEPGEPAPAVVRDSLTGDVVRIRCRMLVLACDAWNDIVARRLGAGHTGQAPGQRVRAAFVPGPADAGALLEQNALALPTAGGVFVTLPAAEDERPPDERTPTETDREELGALLDDVLVEGQAAAWLLTGPGAERPRAVVAALRLPAGVPCVALPGVGVIDVGRIARSTCRATRAAIGRRVRPARSRGIWLPGGEVASFAGECAAVRATGLPAVDAARVVESYGSLWRLALGADAPAQARHEVGGPRLAGSGPFEPEVRWAMREEAARTLSDLLFRWRLPEICPGAGASVAEATLAIMAAEDGWSPRRIERERERWQRESAGLWSPLSP